MRSNPPPATKRPEPPNYRPNQTLELKKQIELLEKILDDVYEVYNTIIEKNNLQALSNKKEAYLKTGEFAVRAYEVYISKKAKEELMK